MPKIYGNKKQSPNLDKTVLYDKVTKMQSLILSELEYINKKKNDRFDCIHCYQNYSEQYQPQKNYYDEFWKSYMINLVCLKRYQEYSEWIRKITKKMANIEKTYNERKKLLQPMESHKRRSLSQSWQNKFQCFHCRKNYRDQESLNIHLSIKHKNENIKIEVGEFCLLQAKIDELNHQFIQKSEWQHNYYIEDE